MAQSLHISPSTYLRIENGESTVWASHLMKICQLLEVDPEELVSSTGNIVNFNRNYNHASASGFGSTNITVVNQSDKAFEILEKVIADQKEEILELKKQAGKIKY